MFKKAFLLLALLSVIFSVPAFPAHADAGPITLGMGTLTSMALSPDGARVAVGTTIGVYFYEAQTFAPQAFWSTGYSVDRVIWSPRGDLLALITHQDETAQVEVRAADSGLALWSHAESAPRRCVEYYSGYRYCYGEPRWRWRWSFSPDGAQFAIARNNTIEIREAVNGAVQQDFDAGDRREYASAAFSPDGKHLAVCCADRRIQIWDISTAQIARTLITWADAMVWTPDGRQLVAGAGRIWDVNQQFEVGHIYGGESIALSPDGSMVASGDGFGIVRITYLKPDYFIFLRGHQASVDEVAFSPDSQVLYSAGDNTVRAWDTATGQLLRLLSGFSPAMRRVAWSADGQRLITNQNHLLAAFDIASRMPIAAGDLQLTYRTRYSSTYSYFSRLSDMIADPAAKLIAVATEGDIALYDSDTLNFVRRLPTNYGVFRLAFSPDGQTLASGGDSPYVVLWAAQTGKPQRTLVASPGKAFVVALAFSADGQTLYSLDGSGLIGTFDLSTGAVSQVQTSGTAHSVRLCLLPRPTKVSEEFHDEECGYQFGAASISPAAGRLAVQHGNSIVVSDLTTGQALYTLDAPGVQRLAVNPQGTRLAAAIGNAVKIWDLGAGELLADYTAHTRLVSDLAFSPDGNIIATSSRDGTVKIWPVP